MMPSSIHQKIGGEIRPRVFSPEIWGTKKSLLTLARCQAGFEQCWQDHQLVLLGALTLPINQIEFSHFFRYGGDDIYISKIIFLWWSLFL